MRNLQFGQNLIKKSDSPKKSTAVTNNSTLSGFIESKWDFKSLNCNNNSMSCIPKF